MATITIIEGPSRVKQLKLAYVLENYTHVLVVRGDGGSFHADLARALEVLRGAEAAVTLVLSDLDCARPRLSAQTTSDIAQATRGGGLVITTHNLGSVHPRLRSWATSVVRLTERDLRMYDPQVWHALAAGAPPAQG